MVTSWRPTEILLQVRFKFLRLVNAMSSKRVQCIELFMRFRVAKLSSFWNAEIVVMKFSFSLLKTTDPSIVDDNLLRPPPTFSPKIGLCPILISTEKKKNYFFMTFYDISSQKHKKKIQSEIFLALVTTITYERYLRSRSNLRQT